MENMENKVRESENSIPQKTEKRRGRAFFAITLIIIAIFISSTFGAVFGFLASRSGSELLSGLIGKEPLNIFSQNQSKEPDVIKQQIIQEDSAVIDVVEKATPSVVSIVITRDVPLMRNFGGLPDFFGSPFDFFGEEDGSGSGGTERQTVGGGTGFFISEDGMIVTNRHVVDDARADYTVVTNDGQEYPASVLARDPVNDIAVIKIEGNGFPVLNMGDSSTIQIGQTVIAIGNSLGEFSNTVSRGIISGLRRNLTAGGAGQTERLTNIIQTDAAINPGNSGGPLLDINGNVIGINVAIAQGAQNIGFAIPSNQVKRVSEQVKTTGRISTPFIGVRYIPITDTIQRENNLPFNYGDLIIRGATMTDFAVIPGSPADKAGLMENDIILEVEGEKISDGNNGRSLADLISERGVGDTITLKVWSKSETKDVRVTLEERK